MQVKYEATIKISVVHPIDSLKNLKDNNEFANDLVQMICDEASQAGGVACYEILNSSVDVR